MSIEEYKTKCILNLLKVSNMIVEKHNKMVNRARMNGNWIDWEYDDETETFKRIN